MRARCAVVLAAASAIAAFALVTFTSVPRASAQVRWDAAVHGGAMLRVLTSQQPGSASATIGPVGEIHAHFALIPMLRLGGYFAYDLSPMEGDLPTRHFRTFGVRAKITPPWPRGDVRSWIFAGAGLALAYAPSYHLRLPPPTGGPAEDTLIEGAGGAFMEIPLGIGVSYKISRPWEIAAELGLRVGVLHGGAAYSGRDGTRSSGAKVGIGSFGDDSVAPYLTIGVQWDK